MLRMTEQLRRRIRLDDAATLHHGDLIGRLCRHRKIMRDEQHAQAMLLAQVAQQAKNLRLHGDVERRRRLVRDEQARLVDHRHRNQDALSLPTGKLVGIVAHAPLRIGQRDLPQRLQHAVADLGASERGMMHAHRLGNLLADGHGGVQRRHRLLKDHADVSAAARAHVLLRKP